MNYFFDTEFYENGKTVELISLGMVSSDGRELYLETADAHVVASSTDWLIANVKPHLRLASPDWPARMQEAPTVWWRGDNLAILCVDASEARDAILAFVGDDPNPMFWAYVATYDWLLFVQLFGTLMDLPENFPNHPMCLKQMWVHRGCPEEQKPRKPVDAHDALADARWNQDFFDNMTMGRL